MKKTLQEAAKQVDLEQAKLVNAERDFKTKRTMYLNSQTKVIAQRAVAAKAKSDLEMLMNETN